MAEYEKIEGPVQEKEPVETDVICPGCGKQNLVVKRTTGREGRNVTEHLLCERCNYQDARMVDKITGEVIFDRSKSL